MAVFTLDGINTIAVCAAAMSIYAQALKRYLDDSDAKQRELGEAIGKTQVSVHRYCLGSRTPDRETAERIAEATAGAVPFELWQRLQMERLGISAANEPSSTSPAAPQQVAA